MLFSKRRQGRTKPRTIEMILDHDGRNWRVYDASVTVTAAELDELDRKLERAMAPRLAREKKLTIFMTTNNEMIPEWMRPFMCHYFNRLLELPLRY
jgi:hypothetical protein